MVLYRKKTSHMPNYKLVINPQALSDILCLPGFVTILPRVDGIWNHNGFFFCDFLTIKVNGSLLPAGKEVSRHCPQRKAQRLSDNPVDALFRLRAVRMCNPDGNPVLFRKPQRKKAFARGMRVHNVVLRMLFEKAVHIVHIIARTAFGQRAHTVNMSAKRFYFFLIIVMAWRSEQEIELYPAPVYMPVVVHNHCFRAAAVHRSQHM